MDNDQDNVHISYMQAYRNYLRVLTENHSENTVRTYMKFIDKYFDYLALKGINLDLPITDLNIDLLISFVKETIQYSDYSKSTVSIMIAGLKRFHNWVIDYEHIELEEETIKSLNDFFKNILTSNLATRTAKMVDTTSFSDDIPIFELIAAARQRIVNRIERERDIAILLFLISTDILPNELCKLVVKDFDYISQNVILQISNSESRHFQVSSEVFDAINKYWVLRGWQMNNDPAFARHDRGAGKKHLSLTTRSIQNIIGNISEAAGFGRKITANMLRNNFYLRVIDYDIALFNIERSLKFNSFNTRCQYYSDEIDKSTRGR